MLPPPPDASDALFLDVDGTLLDIAPRPDAVLVTDALRDALATLDRRLAGALALVSGRAIADLDTLFAPLRLRASGVHGAEMRFAADGAIESAGAHPLSEDLLAEAREVAGRYPGTLVEDKRFSAAVHYRAVPEAASDLRRDLDAILASPHGTGCRILPGHMVFEVKRAGFDKGVAVASFMRDLVFRGRRPIFVGDDITDLPGFAEAMAQGGLAYSVTTMRENVSGHFPDPAAVRAWLLEAAQAG